MKLYLVLLGLLFPILVSGKTITVDGNRLESGDWLRERDLKAMYGLSILPPGELPK